LLASFEPRRSENPTRGHFAQKPTNNGGRALSRPQARPSNATSTPATPARDALSGQYASVEDARRVLSSSLLERAQDLASRESGLAVVVTYRIDGTAQASVVNAGVIRHP